MESNGRNLGRSGVHNIGKTSENIMMLCLNALENLRNQPDLEKVVNRPQAEISELY